MNKKLIKYGIKRPRKTKKNLLIKKAVKKAVHDYKETYKRLAYE
jgi:hypothetical protein